MLNILLSWLVLAGIVWLTAALLPGFRVRGFKGAVVVAALFGIMNWALGWFLFTIIGLATLGLGFVLAFVTHVLVNAILLKLTDTLSRSLTIRSFGHAFAGAVVIGLCSVAANWALAV